MRAVLLTLLRLSLPLTAQSGATPWDILGTRPVVTPFASFGGGNTILAPNGDVFISGSPCGAPGTVKLTGTNGTPAACDTVIARVNSSGTFVFAIQLAGVDDPGPTMLLDPKGNLFIGGSTNSPSRFPTTSGAYLPTAPQPNTSGFACKLAAANGVPIFCTFLPQTPNLVGPLDANGNLVFTTGQTTIFTLDSTGSKLDLQSVPIDGGVDSIVPNADGTFYLTGNTGSPQFPFTTPPAVPPSSNQQAYFYGKFEPNTGFLFALYSASGVASTMQPS